LPGSASALATFTVETMVAADVVGGSSSATVIVLSKANVEHGTF
jgi:hypothetical protein